MEKFTFAYVPKSVEELKALPESTIDSPYKSAALAMLVLCNYKNDVEGTHSMLDFLKGPEPLNPYEKQFLRDRLRDKEYKPFSFFEGANVDNDYTPTLPLTIVISETPYSFREDNWATLYIKSGGADSPRPIKFRRKPSTNQWFVNEIQCLSDIRTPKSSDPWA